MRWKRAADEAQDLTQGFFARAFEKRYFAGYEPDKARFRTFLKVCLDRFIMEDTRSEQRQKRGGEAVKLSLDFDIAEQELERTDVGDLDAYFDREWMRSLLGSALDALETVCRDQGKSRHFEVFKRYVIEGDKSYAEVAAELNLKVSDVTNYLSWSRREFRRVALDQLRDITATDEEFRAEALAVLGVEA